MNALIVVLLLCATAISSVALGVFGAYCAVTGLLAVCNPSRPTATFAAALMSHQSHLAGD
ncbi:MAG: hypothetical protein WCC22_14120 [Terriglobales bacterium]